MWYIFNSSNVCTGCSNSAPDAIDLKNRSETAVENNGVFDIANVVLTDGVVTPIPAVVLTAAQLSNASILTQITTLETGQTPRLYREASLNSTTINAVTGRTAAQDLAYIDNQIAILRTQLVK